MFGSSILNQLFTNLVESGFAPKIYHSVIQKPLKKGSFAPAYPIPGGGYNYIGPDDTKGFSAYCRQTGSAEGVVEKVSSFQKRYKFQVPHRLVFFNDNEARDHETVKGQLLKAVMKTDKLTVQRIHVLASQILSEEAPTGKFTFDASTFYFAVDFSVLLELQTDNCTTEITCEGTPNPVSS
jgi:hypothetical protein